MFLLLMMTLLGKQLGFNVNWSTEMQFTPTYPGQEAGTLVWLQKDSYASLGVRGKRQPETLQLKEGEEIELVFRAPSKGGEFEEKVFALTAAQQPITFEIKATSSSYQFLYKLAGSSSFEEAGTIPNSLLNPIFTGAHLGVYAQGEDHRPCLNDAYFKYARWAVGQ